MGTQQRDDLLSLGNQFGLVLEQREDADLHGGDARVESQHSTGLALTLLVGDLFFVVGAGEDR
jgi:hypothetical protein